LLEKAATANPQALQPRIQQSRYWLTKGDSAKALAAARSAVTAQPDNPAALNLLGAAQFASKDLDNALGTYRKLVDQLPNQAAPHLKLAQVQIAMKQAGEARKSLQEAIRLKPDLTEAQLLLGSLEIQSARYDEALKIARQIQQQTPKALAGWCWKAMPLRQKVVPTRSSHTSARTSFHHLPPHSSASIRRWPGQGASTKAQNDSPTGLPPIRKTIARASI
jgi:tetratricopeptide (TPR) repeat protein